MDICTAITNIPFLWNAVLSGTSDETVTHRVLIWASLTGEVLVAVGILLEIEPPLSSKKILSFAAVIIGVIVSAAGTLLLLNFDEAISSAQQSTISAQNVEISDLEKKTASATADAGQANERASKLEKEAADLRLQAADAQKEVERLSAVASDARDRAAKSELALEKFKAPRTLDSTRQEAIAAAIRQFRRPKISNRDCLGGGRRNGILGIFIRRAKNRRLGICPAARAAHRRQSACWHSNSGNSRRRYSS